jgi:hypothetical protein
MQKHKFGIMCPSALRLESLPVPHEHEKYCGDVSYIGCTGMYYVTRISQQMQKHKFNVTCPDALFMETGPITPEHQKYCVDILCPGFVESIPVPPKKEK